MAKKDPMQARSQFVEDARSLLTLTDPRTSVPYAEYAAAASVRGEPIITWKQWQQLSDILGNRRVADPSAIHSVVERMRENAWVFP